MKVKLSSATKRLQMDKAQSNLLVVVLAATVITIFGLVSIKALLSQASYQRHVLNARRDGVKQLRSNITAANTLVDQYNKVFEGTDPTNIIGGRKDTSPNATPPNGDNARIVLDALPTNYDFPALITSINKILRDDGISSPTIGGTDMSASVKSDPTSDPSPQPIQFTIGGSSSYGGYQKLISDLERSIRPFDVSDVHMSGSVSNLTFSLSVTTYFQPAKSLTIGSKEMH